MRIDLNCDLGEGTGTDAELMPLISSANIACGGHAGDVGTMKAAVELAHRHGVSIGAHPGFADREGFGRREQAVDVRAVRALVIDQIRALQTIAEACGSRLTHVKPHGALYNMAARDALLARGVAEAVRDCDSALVLVGLADSHLIAESRTCGLAAAAEGFADRRYMPDGSLVPRSQSGAILDNEADVEAQALGLARDGRVVCADGTSRAIRADTLGVHGDGPRAVQSLRAIRAAFAKAGISVRSLVELS